MKRILFLVVFVVMASFLMPAVSEAFLVSKYSEYKYIGGSFAVAVYRINCSTPDSFIGYVEFVQCGDGRWVATSDVPYGAWLLIKYFINPMDRVETGRHGIIWAEKSAAQIQADCSKDKKSKGQMDNVYPLAESDNTLMLQGWYHADRVEPLGFQFFSRAKFKGERDGKQSITIPVTPVTVDEWIDNPTPGSVQSTQQVVPQPQIQYPAPTVPVVEPVRNELETGIELPACIKRLDIKIQNRDGKPFTGSATIWLTLNNVTKEYSIINGKIIDKKGKLCPFKGKYYINDCKGAVFTIRASGLNRYEISEDCILLYCE